MIDPRTYDSFGELKSYSALYGGATPLLLITYDQRDGLGRIVQKSESILGGVPDVDHDEDDTGGRLENVTKNGVDRNSDHDASSTGRWHRIFAVLATYDDQARRIRQVLADHPYEYKNDGDLSAKHVGSDTMTYEYDSFGSPRAVHLADGREIEDVVDGQNRRIEKIGRCIPGYRQK